ncbi:MAG: nucleotidyltransferase family protein [Pseudomonadota bacterium]
MPILILAAGQSSRMRGADKLLQDVGGQPLLRKQVLMAQALNGPVFVAVQPGATARGQAIADLDATILTVPEASEGMSGTMRGAVPQLPDSPAFMMLLGDLVALEVNDLRAVLDAYYTNPDHLIWRGATNDGKPGHPIIFDASLRPAFTDLTGDSGGESLVNPLKPQTCLVPLPGYRARLDLDTPEEWAAWRAAIS